MGSLECQVKESAFSLIAVGSHWVCGMGAWYDCSTQMRKLSTTFPEDSLVHNPKDWEPLATLEPRRGPQWSVFLCPKALRWQCRKGRSAKVSLLGPSSPVTSKCMSEHCTQSGSAEGLCECQLLIQERVLCYVCDFFRCWNPNTINRESIGTWDWVPPEDGTGFRCSWIQGLNQVLCILSLSPFLGFASIFILALFSPL
jgi:hypothetical protein